MATSADDSPDLGDARPRSIFVRLSRFVAWVCLAFSVLMLLGLASVYAPCFLGERGTCVTGILMLVGGLVVLAFGALGLLVLALTRRRRKRS